MCIRHIRIYLVIQPLYILFCNILLSRNVIVKAIGFCMLIKTRKCTLVVNHATFQHNIYGTLMFIPRIERYKYTHKRAPRSSRAIHCTQASRKQVSIHNVLRQECEVVLKMTASWTKHVSHKSWGTICLIVKLPWLFSRNTSEPPRLDDGHQRSLSSLFTIAYVTHF